MALIEFKYESVSLNINKVCFDEEQYIHNTGEKSRKSQRVTEWCRCKKCGGMGTNVKCLSCGEIEAFEYFELSNMRCDNRNVVTERNSTTVPQLYLT